MPNVLLDNMFVVKVDVEYVVQWDQPLHESGSRI